MHILQPPYPVNKRCPAKQTSPRVTGEGERKEKNSARERKREVAIGKG